jgi:Fe2+ or Zn2+ uptake regulation protein
MSDLSLIETLRSTGLKATAPRKAVIRLLEERRAHLSAEDIHRALVAQGVRIDLSSVYRTLGLLARLGLVRAVGPSERHGHFEVEHDEPLHLVCTQCGSVIEANLPRVAAVQKSVAELAQTNGFALDQFTVEATGICAACHPSPTVSESGKRHARSQGRRSSGKPRR